MQQPTVEGSPSSHFFTDRPIKSSSEDRLNRRDFAFAVGESVVAWEGSDSLVLGLDGGWGSGKTSIINLVLERLATANAPPDVIKFNPWEWSGHEELATAFFREAEVILKIQATPTASKIAERLARYAHVLTAGGELAYSAAPLVAGASAILIAAGGATFVVDQLSSPLASATIVGLGALGLVASTISRLMTAVGSALRQPGAVRKSLAGAKCELAEALREYDRNILVVVDDLDRLTPPDAVRMLQVVKANADLPKMVYLLAYDSGGLGKSIKAALHVSGRDYLDKIVQVPVKVPKPDQLALERVLFAGMDSILQPEGIQRRFDKDRWSSLFVDIGSKSGINHYFSTPRRVFRFLSVLAFDLGRHLDRGECNVDPVDFIAVEALKVFDVPAYDAVASEKRLLTGGAGGDARTRERAKEGVDRILQTVLNNRTSAIVEHVLTECFPSAEWALTGIQQHDGHLQLLADRRVSHPDMFDFYFQMAVPSSSLSEGAIQAVVDNVSENKECLTESLRALIQDERIRPFLRDLAAKTSRVPVGKEQDFIASLFDVGDQMEAQVERGLDVSDTLRCEFIIEDLLKRSPMADRLRVLEAAAEASEGVSLPLTFLRFEVHRLDRERDVLIDDESGLRELGRRLVTRVGELAANGRLLNHRHLVELMVAWSEFGRPEDVGGWAEECAASPESLLRLFRGFVGYAGSEGRHPLARYIEFDSAVQRAESWIASGNLDSATTEGLAQALAAAREFYHH